jgi:hypothetical protein
MKGSIMREATLCNSLSSSQALWELIKGHLFTLLQCIWKVQGLKTRIEVWLFLLFRVGVRADGWPKDT